ncbi:MAG: phage tail tape measure protein [Streptomycetaceae bacterium]|nr:phage tail tape measure protein [Streptomycetaceae bacterium]
MPRTVSVRLLADVAQFTAEVGGKAVGAVKGLAGELDKAAQKGKVDRITAAMAGLGIGLTGVAATAVKMSMDFEKSMSAVSAATHANASDIDALRKAAIQAGKDTQYSATQAADGITELAKAGVSTADILGGGLKGALDLAAAGQLGVGEAAETAASAMTQFGLSGDQVPHIADLLAAAAGKAQGSVHDMGYALNQSGLVAAQFGLSIEDTTGVLAEFASAGLLGSDAGTSFKTMLLAMANPTQQTKDLMHELGISFYDAQGNFVGLSGVAQILQTKLRGLTQEQRNQALGQIFGNDAIRAASILYTDGAAGVQKWATNVNATGYATTTAAKLTDNLAGDLERLRGSLETVAIQSGGGATEGLRKLTQGANAAVNAFADLPGWVQQSVTVLSGIGGVSLLAAAGFLKARGTVKDFMDELRDMGPRGAAAAGAIGRIAGIAGKLTLVGGAAVAVYEGFRLVSDWTEKKSAPVKADIDALTESIKTFAQTGQVTGELAAKYGDALQRVHDDVVGVTSGMQQLAAVQADVAAGISSAEGLENWNPVDPQAVQRIKDLDTALTGLVKNGGATQATVFLRELANSGKLTAAQYASLVSMLPNYTQAATVANVANGGLAKGFGSASANAQTLKGKLEDATDAGQKLTDVWNQLNGALLSSNKTELAAQQAIDAVKKSFKDNGKAIDESGLKYDKHGKIVKQNADQVRANSEAALKNRIAVGDAAKAAVEAAQSKFEETGSVKEANKVYTEHISQLRRVLGEAGLNKKQIDQLIGSYGKMPQDVYTKLHQPGMEDALHKTNDLWNKLQGVDGNWVARLSTKGYAGVANDLRHLLAAQQALKDNTSVNEANRELGHFLASGGPVYGPGTGTSDSIPARLSAGEHVWTAAEVAALGGQQAMLALRAAVRSGKSVVEVDMTPGFARGGVVMPFPTDVKKTKIPDVSYGLPGGGAPGYKWMENAVHTVFPGMAVYSDYRPGAITITGNRSYHAVGRAVDFAPSKPLAEWINLHFMRATKELITPWQSLNIHNGARHTYSALVENEHNFAGGNAHDHWAMANGGIINEPVFGFGLRSGDTYSFGERGSETVTPGVGGGTTVVNNINLIANLAAGSNPAEHGRQIAHYLEQHFARGGEIRVNGRVLVSN